MDHQAEPGEAAASLEKAAEIIRQADSLGRDAMDGDAGIESEGPIEQAHAGMLAIVGVLQHADRLPSGQDLPDLAAEGEVDGGHADLVAFEGIEPETTFIELAQNRLAGDDAHDLGDGTLLLVHPYFDLDAPTVIGHRGAAGVRPENTLVSFEAALEDGAQILESDIQLSRDGVPILLHDPFLDRTTEARGDANRLDLADLKQLDAGYRFADEQGQPTYRGRGIRIATLEEAFEAFPDARFNLEIKTPDPRATAATLELVSRFDRAERTLLAAGEDPVMKVLREALADHSVLPAVSACLSEVLASVQSALTGSPMPEGVMALQIPASFADRPLATRELIDHAHAHGVAVHVWTINDLPQIGSLIDLGVDGIVTDHPGRMAQWLRRGERG